MAGCRRRDVEDPQTREELDLVGAVAPGSPTVDRAAAVEAMPLGSTTKPQTGPSVWDVHAAAPKPVPSVRVVLRWRT